MTPIASATNPLLRLVVFVIDEQRYALPLTAVDRVLPMAAVSPLPASPPIALGAINVHGTIVPVLDIRRRLGFEPRAWGLSTHVLLARTSRRPVALPVDEVRGVSEVPVRAVIAPATVLPGIGQVAGIVPLPDGLLLIQDLDAFLSLDEEDQLAAALEGKGS